MRKIPIYEKNTNFLWKIPIFFLEKIPIFWRILEKKLEKIQILRKIQIFEKHFGE